MLDAPARGRVQSTFRSSQGPSPKSRYQRGSSLLSSDRFIRNTTSRIRSRSSVELEASFAKTAVTVKAFGHATSGKPTAQRAGLGSCAECRNARHACIMPCMFPDMPVEACCLPWGHGGCCFRGDRARRHFACRRGQPAPVIPDSPENRNPYAGGDPGHMKPPNRIAYHRGSARWASGTNPVTPHPRDAGCAARMSSHTVDAIAG